MIRVDIHTKTQVNKANPEEHNRHMTLIRELIKAPLKISGNINNLKAVVSCPSAARYAVNVSQAKTIIKEFKSQPDQLRELLGTE
jgi:ribosomal protein S25